MTTIAFDGITMAADSLSVDSWGLRDYLDKIWSNEYVVIGCAGELGHIRAWLRTLGKGTLVSDLLRDGYLHWHKDDNNPTIMVVDRATKALYKSTHGHFIPTTYKFHAAGSGKILPEQRCILARPRGKRLRLPLCLTTTQAVILWR